MTPRILYEDVHLCVLSKPAGLLSQSDASGEPSLVDWLRGHFGRDFVGLVHRLDRNTTGLMVAAKRTKSADRLSEALRSGVLRREYLAWLSGNLPAAARWRHFLEKNERTNVVRVVKGGGKEAILDVEPVAQGEYRGRALTLARFRLETGRSHQIRVQASFEGYPLLGDMKYGDRLPPELRVFGRPALHSALLEFPHPMTKELMRFEEELPADMAGLVRVPGSDRE